MSRIILEGFMGAGKSACGRTLSKELLLPYMDTDREIEKREKKKVSAIFEEFGEEYFRKAETALMKELAEGSKCHNGVISVGGGLPIREENRYWMQKAGIVVYLKLSPELLINRLEGTEWRRPMLKGGVREKVESLLPVREPMYIEAADYVLDTDGMDIVGVVNQLKLICHGRSSLPRRERA
ncbi:MAG: shikimate kinase [Lachnospiraceae bacterium]|nr:shikimate kinase [Lachnospiraceae bacterium]